MNRRPPRSTPFPNTTLFRSVPFSRLNTTTLNLSHFNIKTRRVTMASLPPRCQGGRPCQGRPPWQRGGRDAMVTRRGLMLKCERLSVVVFNLEKGTDRKSVVLGKGVDLGGRRFI